MSTLRLLHSDRFSKEEWEGKSWRCRMLLTASTSFTLVQWSTLSLCSPYSMSTSLRHKSFKFDVHCILMSLTLDVPTVWPSPLPTLTGNAHNWKQDYCIHLKSARSTRTPQSSMATSSRDTDPLCSSMLCMIDNRRKWKGDCVSEGRVGFSAVPVSECVRSLIWPNPLAHNKFCVVSNIICWANKSY